MSRSPKLQKRQSWYSGNQDYYHNVYLKSSHWRNLKSQKLQQVRLCEYCGRKRFLVVHHVNYKRLYDVVLSDLMVLCERCHHRHHEHKVPTKKERRKRGEIHRFLVEQKRQQNLPVLVAQQKTQLFPREKTGGANPSEDTILGRWLSSDSSNL